MTDARGAFSLRLPANVASARLEIRAEWMGSASLRPAMAILPWTSPEMRTTSLPVASLRTGMPERGTAREARRHPKIGRLFGRPYPCRLRATNGCADNLCGTSEVLQLERKSAEVGHFWAFKRTASPANRLLSTRSGPWCCLRQNGSSICNARFGSVRVER